MTGHGVPLRFATKRSMARCGRAAISSRWFSANFRPLLTANGGACSYAEYWYAERRIDPGFFRLMEPRVPEWA